MIAIPRLRVVLLPVALVAAGGCLATRSDVEQLQLGLSALQDSLRVQRAQAAQSDSATRSVVREMSQQLGETFMRRFAVLSDSVRNVSAALQRLNGNVTLAMHGLNEQMVAVQEGIGISQKRIADLGTKVEALPAVSPPSAGGPATGTKPPTGTTSGRGAAAPAAPPPAQLWTLGRDALTKNATASARENFQTLVDNYPTYERVGEAQMYIADAYAQEGNRPAADSVYAFVVTKYAGTPQAARSLYKRAEFALDAGDPDRARSLFQEIVDKYPRSNEHDLAADRLKSPLKKP